MEQVAEPAGVDPRFPRRTAAPYGASGGRAFPSGYVAPAWAVKHGPCRPRAKLGVAGADGTGGLGRLHEHLVAGREGSVALGCLGAAVGRAVASHHVWGAMAEQVLDIELARVMRDGPGGERVAEAVGVHPRDARGPAEPAQQLLEPVRPETDAGVEARVAGSDEERARGGTAVGEIGGEGVAAASGEGHDAVLAALAVADAQPALRPGAVREVQLDRFGTADAGVQQREKDRPVAAAHHRGGVAASDQAGDLRGCERRHDLAGQPHVAEAAERVVVGVAGGVQPTEEAAHLAEVAVASIGPMGGEPGQVGDDVVGTDLAGIQRRPVFPEAAQKRPSDSR